MSIKSILAKTFTWWNGATIGTSLFTMRRGEKVGTDLSGNTYYRAKNKRENTSGSYVGNERRWVIYQGSNDASKVPSEWHGWLHGAFEDLPESNLPPPRIWEVDFTPNATGTARAYLPRGALERGGNAAPTRGDYESWTPGAPDA